MGNARVHCARSQLSPSYIRTRYVLHCVLFFFSNTHVMSCPRGGGEAVVVHVVYYVVGSRLDFIRRSIDSTVGRPFVKPNASLQVPQRAVGRPCGEATHRPKYDKNLHLLLYYVQRTYVGIYVRTFWAIRMEVREPIFQRIRQQGPCRAAGRLDGGGPPNDIIDMSKIPEYLSSLLCQRKPTPNTTRSLTLCSR